ncbi:hypothetical protein CLOM_g7726 [Closterium sp. NIES-68]|nr:hypothetical protein CLOM_g7726 [Closterium sp. NIES-68]GJP77543.1 hypothetical protein CLOP_g7919 [Closterium sp. NIES-67]
MAPLARQAILLLVALSLATSATAVISPFWGGAQPLEPVAKTLIAQWNAAAKKKPALLVGSYDPSGSGNGIKGFYNGTYLIGAASEPITTASESGQAAKITIPVLVAAYNFFVHGPGTVILSVAESYSIYSGATTDWSGVPGAKGKITGPITRYARSDKVGTTAIIQQLWTKAGTAYAGGKQDGSPLTFSGLLTVASNTAMCNAVVAKVGAIGYAHVSACAAQVKKFGAKKLIAETLLKNALGQALNSKTWIATNALVGAPPAPDASWDSIDQIWKAVSKAPAAASMQYVFVKKVLPKAGGAVAKQFLITALPKFKGLAGANGFNVVPPAWFNPSKNAASGITVSAS